MSTDEPMGKGRLELETADTEAVTATPRAGRDSPGAVFEPGSKIGRFLVVSQLGAGGMGVVLAAQDPLLDRKVAVKLLKPGAFGDHAADRARGRLLREAQAMARLSHPNVLPVFDAGDLGEQVFIAMELVDGVNLGQWLKQEKRSWREVVEVFVKAGRGLVAAHRAGLVHRDFKPENVLVGRQGAVRVADFGLVGTSGVVVASASVADAGKAITSSSDSLEESLTHTGTLLGTPCYMAPEQHRGEETDARADQFAFCVALYEALYGQRPFAGETMEELSAHVRAGKLREPPASASVPTWVRDIVERGLRRDRDDRYPSMKALLADLEHDPVAARRRRLAFAGLAAVFVALASGIVFALTRSGAADPCAGVEGELSGVWDEQVKAATERTLLDSGREHAQATYQRFAKLLDEYAATWTRARTETCRAERRKGAQADPLAQLRSVCLAQRRDELEAATALLTEKPDEQIVDKAILLAYELPPLEVCMSENTAPAMIPPPDDPGLRASVATLRKQLARARVYRFADKREEGLSIARPALAEARSLGYAPLEAEALFEVCVLEKLSWNQGDWEAAYQKLREAAEIAERSRSDWLAAMARIEQLSTASLNRGQSRAEMESLRKDAEAAVERAGGDDLLRARYLNAAAVTAFKLDDREQERVYERRALETWKRVLPSDHPEPATCRHSLGVSLMLDGRLDEARPEIEGALATLERALGADHPAVANAIDSMACVHVLRGEYETAVQNFERALGSFERSLGPERSNINEQLIGLWMTYMLQGEPAQARGMIDRFRGHGPGGEEIAASETGWSYISEGRYREALSECQRSLAAAKPWGIFDQRFRGALSCIGRAHLELGDARRAVEPLTRGLSEWQRVPQYALLNFRPELRFTLARALWDSKRDRKRALELAGQALDEYREMRTHGQRWMLGDLAAVEAWLQERGVR